MFLSAFSSQCFSLDKIGIFYRSRSTPTTETLAAPRSCAAHNLRSSNASSSGSLAPFKMYLQQSCGKCSTELSATGFYLGLFWANIVLTWKLIIGSLLLRDLPVVMDKQGLI